ncbi:MAG: hypothetical protein U1E73_00555 [Planctomycetota bacterium]
MRAGACLVLATLLAAAPAQQARSQHGPIRFDSSGLVLPAGEFTVVELVEATAAYLCRNYLYDLPVLERAGGFTLQRQLAVDAPGSEELLYALLSTRDLAVFPVDEVRGLFAVVPLNGQAQQNQGSPMLLGITPWRSREDILRRPNLREIVYTGITVANTDARSLAGMFAMALPTGWQPGRLYACAREERFLVLYGYRDQVAQAIRTAEALDRPTGRTTEDLRQRLERLERELAEVRALLEAKAR